VEVRANRPLQTFLVVGAVVGTLLVFLVPRWAGIDEPYHYLRTVDIADANLVPTRGELPGDVEGGTICISDERRADLFEDRAPYLRHLIPNGDETDPLKVGGVCQRDGRPGRLVDVATYAWYNPASYIPQVIGVGGAQVAGTGVGGALLAGRLATLAAYLALCGVAIAMAPRGRWALVAVALLPASLFQAATSLSPDAFTVAAVLLVVAGALRAADSDLALTRGRVVVEALVVCGVLAVAKPTYIVLVSCYLIVFAGRAVDGLSRWHHWPVLVPVATALALSFGWNAVFRDLFVCDVRYFGVTTDPDAQLSTLVRRPWTLLRAAGDALIDHGSHWVRGTAAVGERVVPWGLAASTAVVAGFTVLGVSSDRPEVSDRSELTALQRVILVGSGVLGYFAVTAGWIVGCGPVGIAVENPPSARLLVPVLVPVLVGLSFSARRTPVRRVPIALALLAVGYVVWLVAMVDTMSV
jgi:hypothetical protein